MAKPKIIRCAIYTRKSTEHNLDLEFNSLHAQREACEAYVKSQDARGLAADPGLLRRWRDLGASLDRPDLKRLLADISARRGGQCGGLQGGPADRSLTDFARLVELFDRHGVSLSPRQEQASLYRPLSFERYAGD